MENNKNTHYVLYALLVGLMAICLVQGWIIYRNHSKSFSDEEAFMAPKNFISKMDESFKRDRHEKRDMFDRFFDKDFFSKHNDPFKDMQNMQRDIEKMLDEPSKQMFQNSWKDWMDDRFPGGSDSISMNTKETKEGYVVTVNIPNLKDDQLKIDLNSENLTIHGSFSQTIQRKDDQGHIVGQYQTDQSLSRSIPIPEGVDINRAQIDHEKDKVIIHLPKVNTSISPHLGS